MEERAPLEAQLNCYCDDKAKEAVIDTIMEEVQKGNTLAMESASIFIGNNKQTTDLATWLQYYIRKVTAREFYAAKNIMDTSTFDTVTWEDLQDTLACKPKIYQLWLGKQVLDH